MAFIPEFVLRSLFKRNSLRAVEGGAEMTLENNLAFDLLVGITPIEIDGAAHPAGKTRVSNGEQDVLATAISAEKPFKLLLRTPITILLKGYKLTKGNHRVKIQVQAKAAGALKFEVVETAQGV